MNSRRYAGMLLAIIFTVSCVATTAFATDVHEPLVVGDEDSESVVVYQTETTPIAGLILTQEGNGPVLKDVSAVVQGNQTLIVKTWDVPPGYDAERLVEDDFEKNGLQYKKAYLLQVSENFDNQTKLASETITVSHDKKDDAIARLQPIIEYSEDGFSGQLTLKTEAIVTEAADTSSYSYAVTDTREFTGFERNDTYNIPKSVSKNGVPLQLVDVNWTQMGEGSYTATASYSGTTSGTTVTNYISTATYIGEVSKKVLSGVTYAVVYEGTLIPIPPPDYNPYFFSAGIAIVLIAALFFLWNKRNNTKVYAMIGKEYHLVHKQKVTMLAPIIDLTPPEISSGNEDFMIMMDWLAARKMKGQFIKIVGKDGMIKEHRITSVRQFHITPNIYEEENTNGNQG